MAKTKLLQTNFTAGEISPTMMGRVDMTRYQNGAAVLSNMLIKPQGGAWFRQGTEYVASAKNAGKKAILREFEFSDIQPYVLEIGEQYIRVYYNGGFVETTPGSGVPLEIVTPYLEADLEALSFAQSADVLYITHPAYQTRKVRRLGANSWDIQLFESLDGPYVGNKSLLPAATLTVSNISSLATVVASTAIFTVPTKKVPEAISAGSGTKIRIKVTGHGLTTGVEVTAQGIFHTKSGITTEPAYPYGNGKYTITVIDANNFDLDGSIKLSGTYSWSIVSGPYGPISFVQAASAYPYVEFRQNNTWRLAKVLQVLTTTRANVDVIQNLKEDLGKRGAILTTGSTPNVINSDRDDSFTNDDIGAFCRVTDGSWYQITSFESHKKVGRTAACILTAYTYPTTTVVLENQDIVANATITSDTALFVSTDVGRHVRLNFGGKWPWCKILEYIDNVTVFVELHGLIPVDPVSIQNLYNNGRTSTWKLGAWSNTTGWPRTVCFHEQRLWFGGSTYEPQALWASQSSDFEYFAPTQYDSVVADNCGIAYSFASNKANPILWLESTSVLLVGTLGAELQVKSSGVGTQPITPTNISIQGQTAYGSLQYCRVVRSGNITLFVQRAARKVIELVYSFQDDSFIGKNLTIANDHILFRGGGVVTMVYQREPNSLVWCLLADGTLATLTYEREHQVYAWQAHTLGGGAFIESICVVNTIDGAEDQLYLLVRRTINGNTVRYIEVLTADVYVTTPQRTSMWHLDCAKRYTGVATTTVTGLTFFANTSVSYVADGVYKGELVVSGAGVATLPVAATNVLFGFKYTGVLGLLPLDGGSKDGAASVGKLKRVGRTVIRLLNSLTFKYGSELNKLDAKVMTDDTGMTQVNTFFTGDKVLELSMGYTLRPGPYFVQDQPYPLNILAVGPDTEVTQ